METNQTEAPVLNRRRFIAAASLVGAGLVLAPRGLNAQNAPVHSTEKKSDNTINIAVVGCGNQGNMLLRSLRGIRNNTGDDKIDLRVVALCDAWPRALKMNVARCRGMFDDKEINGYAAIEDLLEKEKRLDAVFIATPVHWHARHTIAALNADKHVYCEKMMSRTVDEGRQMVLAAQKAGKLLQIGYQRRSNPNYRFAYNVLLKGFKFLGRVTNANAQWNTGVSLNRDFYYSPQARKTITEDVLKAGGFYADAEGKPFSREDALHRFFNWRWFKQYSNGLISDLGSHQIDVFNWVLGRPHSVIAGGGNDYYSTALARSEYDYSNRERVPYRPRDWYDNVMSILDYKNIPGRPAGEVARACHQVLAASSGGYLGAFPDEPCENFLGDSGTLRMAEREMMTRVSAERIHRRLLDELVAKHLLDRDFMPQMSKKMEELERKAVMRAETSIPPPANFASRLTKLPHQPHVENFLRVVRDNPGNDPAKGVTLNCDGACAFQSEGAVHLVNRAVEAQKRLFLDDYDLGLESVPGKLVV